MTRAKSGGARVTLQDRILSKFGEEKVRDARDRLCTRCVFFDFNGRPCYLLPITSEGKDCPYFSTGDQRPKEIV